MKRSSRKSGWFFGKGVFRFDALLLFQGAFTFSFGRPKEKGNKKKKRRLPFGDGSEAVPGGNAGTRFAQTACVSSRRSPLLRFFAPKLRPEPSSSVGTHGPCVLNTNHLYTGFLIIPTQRVKEYMHELKVSSSVKKRTHEPCVPTRNNIALHWLQVWLPKCISPHNFSRFNTPRLPSPSTNPIQSQM